MRKYYLIASVMITSIILGGCNNIATNKVNTEEINITEQGKDSPEWQSVTVDDVDYYRYYTGSSSVNTEYGIYKYQDSLVCMVNYFDCGNYYMDTFALTDEQQEAFIEELNQGVIKDDNEEEGEEEERDGGYSSYGEVSVNGIGYAVAALNLDKLGIELAEDPAIVDGIPEELGAYEEADLTRMMEQGSNNISVIFIGTLGEPAYIHMINEQIGQEIAEDVTKVTVIEENEQDFVMELETGNQEIYHVTVTYLGYVADIQAMEREENEQGESGQTGYTSMVMVNGKLYQDTGRKSTDTLRCGVMDGSIDSEVGEGEIPTVNNQSNFGTGYGYQYGRDEGTIEIDINDEWWVFESMDKE